MVVSASEATSLWSGRSKLTEACSLERLDGEGWMGELSGDGRSFRFLCCGVEWFSWVRTWLSEKTTVLLGVGFLRLTALRVMSRSWRPDEEEWEVEVLVVRGVKNLLNRLGVIGGGFFGFLEAGLCKGDEGGGEEAKVCEDEGRSS